MIYLTDQDSDGQVTQERARLTQCLRPFISPTTIDEANIAAEIVIGIVSPRVNPLFWSIVENQIRIAAVNWLAENMSQPILPWLCGQVEGCRLSLPGGGLPVPDQTVPTGVLPDTVEYRNALKSVQAARWLREQNSQLRKDAEAELDAQRRAGGGKLFPDYRPIIE